MGYSALCNSLIFILRFISKQAFQHTIISGNIDVIKIHEEDEEKNVELVPIIFSFFKKTYYSKNNALVITMEIKKMHRHLNEIFIPQIMYQAYQCLNNRLSCHCSQTLTHIQQYCPLRCGLCSPAPSAATSAQKMGWQLQLIITAGSLFAASIVGYVAVHKRKAMKRRKERRAKAAKPDQE